MADTYHKRTVGTRTLSPETQMMGYGFEPHLSEGSLKPPVFLTSTFVFRTAQDGKDFFDYTSGRKPLPAGSAGGLVYSRFNNPNLEVLEDRLALWDEAEAAVVFSSGMSALATTFLAHLRAGDVLLYCEPLYGGTETLIAKALPNYGIRHVAFSDGLSRAAATAAATAAMAAGRVALIMTETPANPTNSLVDLALMAAVADDIGRRQGHRPLVVTDNTLLGPLFQNPLLGTASNMSLEDNMMITYKKGFKWLKRSLNNRMREYFRSELTQLKMGLEDRMKENLAMFSGGQRQALTLLMMVLSKPDLILLDEHTAALDPKNAQIVLELTHKFIREYKLTSMMITHNMSHAIEFGNRLLMMDKGEIIFDVEGEEKQALTVEKLIEKFHQIRHKTFENDRTLLSEE